MTRLEKIEKALNKLGRNFTEGEKLGAFSMSKKIELAEESSRLAYAVLSAVVDEIKEIKANG